MTTKPFDFSQSHVLILGTGREGTAAATFLATTYPNARITVADQHEIAWTLPNIPLRTGADYPTSLSEWDIVVVSPGIPPHTPLLTTAQRITTGTNIFFEHCNGTTIGVTGSKGKSTTASIINHILNHAKKRSRLVGNIGTSALTELQKTNTTADIWVVELSSYQTRLLEQGPHIAVITTLFPEHLDYHGSVEQYYTDKLRITTTQSKRDLLIYNQNNEELQQRVCQRSTSLQANKIPWPSETGAHIHNQHILYGIETILPASNIPLLGEHNLSNVLGAITVAKQLAIDNTRIAEAIRTFQPLPHRLQPVGAFRDITFINDSLATTPEATLAALQTISPVGTLFLGGLDRGYDFTALTQHIVALHIPNVILFPDSGATIAAALDTAGYNGTIHHSSTMEDAVRWAYEHTPAHTTALLSCASPSYSIFKNFEDRGNQFVRWIKELQ